MGIINNYPMKKSLFFLLLSGFILSLEAQDQPDTTKLPLTTPIEINGVFPNLTIVGPHENRSESGIGALLPWADRLWMIGYVAHISGSRIGLYEISEDMTMKMHPESVTGTFANRFSHRELDVAIIGPHLIDSKGNVRTYPELAKHRLTATMLHLTDPANKVYFLTMEGLFFEASVNTDMEVTLLYDLIKELDLPEKARPHFKGGFTGNGRVVVANNSYYHEDYLGKWQAGRLAEWDGDKWTIIDKNPYMEVNGKNSSTFQNPIFATGWDNKSVLLKCFNDISGTWKTYRLPRGSHSFDHAWNTEWMRIREAQTERFIMDIHGIFYELPIMAYAGKIWGIKPICYHLRLVPDFCFWRGMFVMAGDQTDHGVGQPQSGLLFQNLDDLWKYGKPAGWGSVWENERVSPDETSDPFLMTGFDKKTLHLKNHTDKPVNLRIEIDFIGNESWEEYAVIKMEPLSYTYHVFQDGFSAHWVRIVSENAGILTATFIYQ